MKRTLRMDDIREGMYITVLKGRTEKRMVSTPQGHMMQSKENPMYKGKVLEVLSIDMPYIAVACHSSRKLPIHDSLDVREVEFMQLSMPYVVGLIPDIKFKKDKFWDGVNIEEMGVIDDSIKKEDTSIDDAGTSINEIFKDL